MKTCIRRQPQQQQQQQRRRQRKFVIREMATMIIFADEICSNSNRSCSIEDSVVYENNFHQLDQLIKILEKTTFSTSIQTF